MEFNLFIVPMTLVAVEILKSVGVSTKWLPLISVCLGAIFGASHGLYYGADIFAQVVEGVAFGASASGIYDVATKSLKGVK